MAALLYCTGMRIEEVLGLRWEDIDTEDKVCTFQTSLLHLWVFQHPQELPMNILSYTTLNLKTFDYPLTTSNAFDHICRQQTYGFA